MHLRLINVTSHKVAAGRGRKDVAAKKVDYPRTDISVSVVINTLLDGRRHTADAVAIEHSACLHADKLSSA